jgi:hypothetical protein
MHKERIHVSNEEETHPVQLKRRMLQVRGEKKRMEKKISKENA